MSYNLFLDDFRIPKDCYNYTKQQIFLNWSWVVVRNYSEFVKQIKKEGLPKFISFDHDLADSHYGTPNNPDIPYDEYKEKTGYDCAKWLLDYCKTNNKIIPKYFIHSMNPVGSKNIRNLLK